MDLVSRFKSIDVTAAPGHVLVLGDFRFVSEGGR